MVAMLILSLRDSWPQTDCDERREQQLHHGLL
jgi:hypothetical protein